MDNSMCTVDGCDRPPRGVRTPMCNAHYFRVYRTGRVGSPQVSDRKRKPCSVEECDSEASGLGYCDKHYQRVRTHGDPSVVLPNVGTGDAHWAWRTDGEISYYSAHQRIASARGPASAQTCVSCGRTAQQWAYDHADPDEKVSKVGPFSLDLHRYQPMCIPCHKRFDLDHLKTCPEQQLADPAR